MHTAARFAPVICLALLACVKGAPARAQVDVPGMEVVLLVDSSGSYRSRQKEAVARAVGLLEQLGAMKVKRGLGGRDRVSVVSLDAIPEVIWQGDLKALKAQDAAAWSQRFASRGDYAGCTDLSAGFRVASQRLQGDPRTTGKYLFVFSDLIDEPPLGSIDLCRKPVRPSPPPEDFPWERLEDVSVSVLWLPKSQKLTWHRAVEVHGLGEQFRLYTDSQSAKDVALPDPPKRKKIEYTAAERAEVGRKAGTLLRWLTMGAGVIGALGFLGVGALVGIVLVVGRLRRRAPIPASRRPPVPLRPLARGVAGTAATGRPHDPR